MDKSSLNIKSNLSPYLAYFCHPIRNDRDWNMKALRFIVKHIILRCHDIIPLAPVLYDVFDEDNTDRSKALSFDQTVVIICHSVIVFVYNGIGLSEGQQAEVHEAQRHDIPVKFIETSAEEMQEILERSIREESKNKDIVNKYFHNIVKSIYDSLPIIATKEEIEALYKVFENIQSKCFLCRRIFDEYYAGEMPLQGSSYHIRVCVPATQHSRGESIYFSHRNTKYVQKVMPTIKKKQSQINLFGQ